MKARSIYFCPYFQNNDIVFKYMTLSQIKDLYVIVTESYVRIALHELGASSIHSCIFAWSFATSQVVLWPTGSFWNNTDVSEIMPVTDSAVNS